MKRPRICVLLAGTSILLVGLCPSIAEASVTLSWTFDGGDLSIHSAIGGAGTLSYKNDETIAATSFGTTGAFPPRLPDGPSGYLHHTIFGNDGDAGYQLHYDGVLPNGGGAYVNDYTIIQDVFIPNTSVWTPFFNTNPDNGNDADWYVAPDAALGIGQYGYSSSGAVAANAWDRLGFVHDTSNGMVSYWVNGVNVFDAPIVDVDGRFSLYSSLDAIPAHLNLHGEGDGSGNYTNEIFLNNFFIADHAFSTGQMQDLGGATAAPILEPAGAKTWGVDANGPVSVGANWFGGVPPTSPNDSAEFSTAITADRMVTVDVPLSLRRMRFDDDNNYTIAGPQPITLAAPSPDAAAILVEDIHGNGAHTISAPLILASDLLIAQDSSQPLTINGALDNSAGRTITTSGTGAVVISGAQSHGGGARLIVDDGTLTLTTNAGTNTSRNLTVNANSTTNFGAGQFLAALNVGAGATATVTSGGPKNLVTNALTIAGGSTPTGKLDVTDNAAIVDYPPAGPSPAPTIRQQIIAGRGGTGLGKPWNGLGITSSTAQDDVAASPNSRSIGYAVNADLPLGALTTFRGQVVDPSSVLIRYTRTADANLDGVVNDDDVTVVGTFYSPGVSKPEWAKGDFDYNGFVDDDDVTLLGVFYNPSAPPLITPVPESAAVVSAVPEPGTLALVGSIALVALLAMGHCHLARGAETRSSRLRSHSSWRGAAVDGAVGDVAADKEQHQPGDDPKHAV